MRVLLDLCLLYMMPCCWSTVMMTRSTANTSVLKSPSSSPPHLYYDPQAYAFQELKAAVEKGNLEAALSLIMEDDRSIDPSQDQNFCLWHAACKGYEGLVSVLLEDERVDPSEPENRAIRLAASESHINIVKLLLADKRLNADGVNEAFKLGCEFGNAELVKITLGHPLVDINKRCFSAFYSTPLNLACERGSVEIVRMLLDDRKLIGHQDFTESPFSAAAAYPEILRMLIADGRALPSQKALLIAATRGYIESVKILLAHPDIDPGYNMSEALGAGIMNCHISIVSVLLKHPRTDPIADSYRDFEELQLNKHLPGYRSILKILLMHPKVNLYTREVYDALPSTFRDHQKLVQAVKNGDKVDADITDWEIFEWILVFFARNKRKDMYEKMLRTLVWSKDTFDEYPVLANVQKMILFTAINQEYDYHLPKELVAEIIQSALTSSFDV